jgi:rod shape-determining protein MreC
MQRIGALEEELQEYKLQLENLPSRLQPDAVAAGLDESVHRYIPARVTHNQISEARNYILLNKGSKHGITEDMGVVSAKGIVGVITHVTPNFSRVIPVLSSGYHPSCMIKNTRFFGPLFWDGKDPRYIHLSRLPNHASYAVGDTVVTSGYSATFPEYILVGVIEDTFNRQQNEEYNSLRVRLFTDFSTLKEVFIIRNPLQEERNQIERGAGRP